MVGGSSTSKTGRHDIAESHNTDGRIKSDVA
jgi:hypothetical protein